MVTSGRASPLEWTDETTRQFDLAIAGSVALAGVYQRAGFAVAIEGSVDPAAVDQQAAEAGLQGELVGIVLHPALEVALARNRERRTKSFDTSILEEVMHRINRDLAAEPLPAGWLRLDNGGELVEATVERVLAAASARGR